MQILDDSSPEPFDTEDRSPIICVPNVKIILSSFSSK